MFKNSVMASGMKAAGKTMVIPELSGLLYKSYINQQLPHEITRNTRNTRNTFMNK